MRLFDHGPGQGIRAARGAFYDIGKIRPVSPPVRVTGPLLDVLEILVDAFGRAEPHGWAIMKATNRSGPTVYGVLARLEDAEWIIGRWEVQGLDVNRPRRRLYSLTPNGYERARVLLSERRPAARRTSRGVRRPGLALLTLSFALAGGGR
jgi:PadR family transcriptional regulator PadR